MDAAICGSESIIGVICKLYHRQIGDIDKMLAIVIAYIERGVLDVSYKQII